MHVSQPQRNLPPQSQPLRQGHRRPSAAALAADSTGTATAVQEMSEGAVGTQLEDEAQLEVVLLCGEKRIVFVL